MMDAPDCSDAIEHLIEILDYDDRPTFVLDSHCDQLRPERKYRACYRNPALQEFFNEWQKQDSSDKLLTRWADRFEQLEEHEAHQPCIDWEMDGIAWRTTTFGVKWKVTYIRKLLADASTAKSAFQHLSYHATYTDDKSISASLSSNTLKGFPQFSLRASHVESAVTHGRKRKRSRSCASADFDNQHRVDVYASGGGNSATKKSGDGAEEAELTENMFRELAEYATVGCAMYHPDGRPIFLNEAYLKLTGMSKDLFRPGVWQQAILPDDLAKVEERWGQLAAGKVIEPFAFRVRRSSETDFRKDGSEAMEYKWLLSNGRARLNPDGTCRTVMGWLTDISYQKWSEHLQAKRLEDALETKRQTEKFIDMVSCFYFTLT
jgi:PAS domain S-box-containing protein